MDKNTYEIIENEIKKYKIFGNNNPSDFVMTLFVSIITVVSVILIYIYPTIGWCLMGATFLCYMIYNILSPARVVFRFFKIDTNRDKINMILIEESKTNKKARKIINDVDFSKPLRRTYVFEPVKIEYLRKLISKMSPSLLSIIKKYGICTNDALKEAIEHYRFKVKTTKEFKFELLPILSIVIAIISSLVHDTFTLAILVLLLFLLAFAVYLMVIRYKRSFYEQNSQKTFYIKMEESLSEIYISNKLCSNIPQFNFKSHLM